jgi:hypothetical protein
MFKWFEEEVKSLPEMFAHLNQNFVALTLEGVLNMLHGSGCGHLHALHSLATSSGTSVLEDVPMEVQKLAGRLVRKWWKNHGLQEAWCRLRNEPHEVGFVTSICSALLVLFLTVVIFFCSWRLLLPRKGMKVRTLRLATRMERLGFHLRKLCGSLRAKRLSRVPTTSKVLRSEGVMRFHDVLNTLAL